MKSFITAGAVLAATFSGALADLCADGSTDDAGNWYCQAVTAITYTGLDGSGSYNKVTDMDSTTGDCSSSAYSYSGSMSPLDEEVSLHFRGPIQIKQFAVYTPSSSSSKKAKRSAMHRHGHAHEHLHKHKREAAAAKRDATEVIATIDGKVVSWVNDFVGSATSAVASVAAAATSVASSAKASTAASSVASSAAAASSTSSSSTSSSGSWSQAAYYDAASGTADGVTFLNHYGGTGSGVFDYEFGNSLSYASEDGTTGASSPQVLSNTQIGSDVEVIIMSDKECDGDCGYVRPGTVAYHGFDGAQKAFFFEFQMPLDGNTDAYTNGDMPAIWMLNSQIPNTLQYGKAACSCWTSGCGEFDIFEVLAPGDLRCKSTLHGNVAGGDSDYFVRPTGSTIKAALIMNGANIHIKVLDDSFDFGSSIDASTISDICEETLIQSTVVSLFALS